MKNLIQAAATALLLPTLGLASDVNLSIESYGSNSIDALTGAAIDYEVVVELSGAPSQGLALLCFDLGFDGGTTLPQAGAANTSAVQNFVSPVGLSNPAGFGGTQSGGGLLQVGGAQNTIKNTFAPQPVGTVITDVAVAGSGVVWVKGRVVVPGTPGVYHLTAGNLIANVIRVGEDGSGEFWAVDEAATGILTGLTINATDCGPLNYCEWKTNSVGCAPRIAWSGTPNLSGSDDFHLVASSVINQEFGLLYWGQTPADLPFAGGTRCVLGPVRRTTVQQSGGSASGTDCTGTYDFHFSHAYMASQGLGAGDPVYAQYWYRDPTNPDGTGIGLTDAAAFAICP